MEKAIPVETSGRVEPVETVEPEKVDERDLREATDQTRSLEEREAKLIAAERQLADVEQRLLEAERRLRENEQQSISMLKRREQDLDERERFIREDFDRLGQERAQLTTLKLEIESRASKDSTPKVETKPQPQKTQGFQCMSCVAICEVINGKQVCPEKEDLICGWGTHTDRKVASQLAEEECRGALKMTANSQTYGKIEGDCPPASCPK
jgi:DNA repair exonuclease SbcCD ATPase subunit